MNDTIVYCQPAFILKHKKYGETSLILDVLTRDHGIVSVLAKGVRKKKSKVAGLLLAFTALKLSYFGKNELKILTHAEQDSLKINLIGLSLYCGFYINEIICFFLHKYDPHPEVFSEYERCLLLLTAAKEVEKNLRFFELNLLENLGYGIQLSVEGINQRQVNPGKKYYFSGESGMVENPEGYIDGRTLLALEAREVLDKQALLEAKQLMRRMIDFHLEGKKLKSRSVLAKIMITT